MDNEIIANIKSLGIDMIDEAKSGHPGIVLGAAPIIYTLYAKHINISTNDPKWLNRDRFILSAGHGSALLYATLYMAGYDISIDDLKNFRHVGYKTPGHPEYGITPGVDMSTGPLGQGISTAVGMALALKKLKQEITIPGRKFESSNSLIDHKIYVLCGDGDLMEGISSEASSIAGTLNLNDLIVLYDSNNISLDGSTNLSFSENVLDRYKAMGWNTIYVKNGEDVKSIDRAINAAKSSKRPTLIEIKTVIGRGSMLEGTNTIHGKPLDKQDIKQLKEKLNIPDIPFYVNEKARTNFQNQINERSNKKYMLWADNYKKYQNGEFNVPKEKYKFLFNEETSLNLKIEDFKFEDNYKEATRKTNRLIMNYIASKIPNFIGGTADTAGATNAYLDKMGDITSKDLTGRNIYFGVRENAMGAILNGLALYNYRPFGATFLSFADYMKPPIRMSALLNLPITYIFTHDSILIGQDGPTHQPIEQLAMLRATPNLNVFRPFDAHELIHTWNYILKDNKPCCLILGRNEVPNIEETKKADISKGAYILKKEEGNLDGIIIATGTEVNTAYILANNLKRNNDLNIRVISMPCLELFNKQSDEYKEEVLPKGYKKIVIEAGSSIGLEKFVYSEKYLITLDRFGVSGPTSEVLKHLNFDYESIEKRVLSLLR